MTRKTNIHLTILSATLALGMGATSALAQQADARAEAEARAAAEAAQSIQLAEGPVDAQSVATELGAHGYGRVEISRTLLGRLMFTASSETNSHVRELVIHPRTGEVLSDVIRAHGSGSVEADGTAGTSMPGVGFTVGASARGGGSGGAGAGDDGGAGGGASGSVGVGGAVNGSVGDDGAGVGVGLGGGN
ncbi:MAG: hypothetical protein JJU40_10495 [Rhodobacteraceae bacterium]|nr:hypothetical protein [Paracoccaceae bacterium]